MKQFIGTCVDNPFRDTNKLIHITESAKTISSSWFLKNCFVNPKVKRLIKEYPNDFSFYSYQNGKIMFYTHSAIEVFYK